MKIDTTGAIAMYNIDFPCKDSSCTGSIANVKGYTDERDIGSTCPVCNTVVVDEHLFEQMVFTDRVTQLILHDIKYQDSISKPGELMKASKYIPEVINSLNREQLNIILNIRKQIIKHKKNDRMDIR